MLNKFLIASPNNDFNEQIINPGPEHIQYNWEWKDFQRTLKIPFLSSDFYGTDQYVRSINLK